MALTTTRQTTPTLLGINSDEPVMLTQFGPDPDEFMWIVQPEDFDNLVAHVNKYGGPGMWNITPVSELSVAELHRVRKQMPDKLDMVLGYMEATAQQ